MRISPSGKQGRFRCDRCGTVPPRGVYTSHPAFRHLCRQCLDDLKTARNPDARASVPQVLGEGCAAFIMNAQPDSVGINLWRTTKCDQLVCTQQPRLTS